MPTLFGKRFLGCARESSDCRTSSMVCSATVRLFVLWYQTEAASFPDLGLAICSASCNQFRVCSRSAVVTGIGHCERDIGSPRNSGYWCLDLWSGSAPWLRRSLTSAGADGPEAAYHFQPLRGPAAQQDVSSYDSSR